MAWCCNCNGKLVWQRQKGPSVWHMELSYLSWEYFRWNSCRYYIRSILQLLILEAHKMQSYLTSFHTKKNLGGENSITIAPTELLYKFSGLFVEDDWAYSFIVPGSIIAIGGFIIWLVLVPRPEDVNLSSDLSVRFLNLCNCFFFSIGISFIIIISIVS